VLTVEDGEILAIGGLLDENERGRLGGEDPLSRRHAWSGEPVPSKTAAATRPTHGLHPPDIIRNAAEPGGHGAALRQIRADQLRVRAGGGASIDAWSRLSSHVPPVALSAPGDVRFGPPRPSPRPSLRRMASDATERLVIERRWSRRTRSLLADVRAAESPGRSRHRSCRPALRAVARGWPAPASARGWWP
jgi:hypothetical protein